MKYPTRRVLGPFILFTGCSSAFNTIFSSLHERSLLGRSLQRRILSDVAQSVRMKGSGSTEALEAVEPAVREESEEQRNENDEGLTLQESETVFFGDLKRTMGEVDESRLLFPEYQSGEVTRMFSSLSYEQTEGSTKLQTQHATGSVIGAAALIAGTTVGAGVLALPSATVATGFVPSTVAMLVAYVFMTASGLLIAELTLNRMAQTGRPGLGLLELYTSSLGSAGRNIGSGAYFFLHYAMMVAYLAQGGANIQQIFGTENGSIAFAALLGISLMVAPASAVEQINNLMVCGVAASFFGIVGIGASSADFSALFDAQNQNPTEVVSCLPILFLALVYQNVVPTVVANLEGDRTKITKAIVAGTTAPLVMFLAWNAVCLGNVLGSRSDLSQVDPVALLQQGGVGNDMLSPLVTTFSVLALVTSVIGFTYGLIDAWTDVFDIPLKSKTYEKYKAGLFALVFLPPLALSFTDPNIFYTALEYGGAFGVSTLFLVLPPAMVWKERYRDVEEPLMTLPMVPFGKLPLTAMWIIAGGLIIQQAAEKIGLLEAI